jgi:hypothetical protein
MRNGNKQKKVRSLIVNKMMGEVKKFALERHITIPSYEKKNLFETFK